MALIATSARRFTFAVGASCRGNGATSVWMGVIDISYRNLRTCELDLQLFEVGKIGAPAPWREDAIIKRDIRVDSPGKNQSRHDQIGADEPHPVIMRAQTMRELLREKQQGGCLALGRDMH